MSVELNLKQSRSKINMKWSPIKKHQFENVYKFRLTTAWIVLSVAVIWWESTIRIEIVIKSGP